MVKIKNPSMAMRAVNVESIRGSEMLAKDIISDSGIILMSEGTIVKKEYKNKLIELGITNIFIKDEIAQGIKIDELTEIKIKEQCAYNMEDRSDGFKKFITKMQDFIFHFHI